MAKNKGPKNQTDEKPTTPTTDDTPTTDTPETGDGDGQDTDGGDEAGDDAEAGDGSAADAVDVTNLPAAPDVPLVAPAKPADDQPLRVPRPVQGGLTEQAIDALLDACERYGINPSADLPKYQPGSRGNGPWRQLEAWSFYPGDERGGIPDAVVVVTAGGVKLKHYVDPAYPMDQDTTDRLRRIFRAFEQDPRTREIREVALPADLALPSESLDGLVRQTDHQYRGGYLKQGGADAAAKRKRPNVVGV